MSTCNHKISCFTKSLSKPDVPYYEKMMRLNHCAELSRFFIDQESKLWQKGLLYIPGMITHAVSIIKDAPLFGVYFITSIVLKLLAIGLSNQSDDFNRIANQSVLLLYSAATTLFLDLVGIFCPPAAYKANHVAYEMFINLEKELSSGI